MGRIFANTLLVSALLVVFSGNAFTERCRDEKDPANLSRFRAVFSGQLLDLSPPNATASFFMKFKVDRMWKGDLVNEIEVAFMPNDERHPQLTFRSTLQKGEHYLVYASGDSERFGSPMVYGDDRTLSLFATDCKPPKRIMNAKKELEALGEGIEVDTIDSPSEQPDIPIVRESFHQVKFPANYKVTINVQGPADYTIVLVAALPTTVTALNGLERLIPKGNVVVVGLKNGEEVSFTTPELQPIDNRKHTLEELEEMELAQEQETDRYFVFEIQATRVQNKPFTTFRDEGEIDDGELRAQTNEKGEVVSAELAKLPQGFKVLISWTRTPTPSPKETNTREP